MTKHLHIQMAQLFGALVASPRGARLVKFASKKVAEHRHIEGSENRFFFGRLKAAARWVDELQLQMVNSSKKDP